MSSKNDNVLYIGVTNDLLRRVSQHRTHFIKGFTNKYNLEKLVYYEHYNDVYLAINREKQLKRWSRKKKEILIDTINKGRKNLYLEICK